MKYDLDYNYNLLKMQAHQYCEFGHQKVKFL